MPSSKSDNGLLPWATAALGMAATCGLAALAARAVPLPSLTAVEEADASWQFLAAFAAATAVVLLLLRTLRGSRVFSVMYLAAVALGTGYLFSTLAGPGVAVVAASAAVLLQLAWRLVAVHDLFLVLGLAGIAADFGASIRPVGVLCILAALSIYDILAVYVTKHMVNMAQSLLRQKAFFAMILPSSTRGFAVRVDKVAPGSGFTFLGTGDLALPAILAASAATVDARASVGAAIGAVAGIVVLRLLFVGKGKGKPMPALPPVAAGAIIGYGIATVIFH